LGNKDKKIKPMIDFFFSKKSHYDSTAVLDYFTSPVKVDIHAHLIPNVDDGAVDVHDSVKLIKGLYDMGLRKLIATPHVSELYPNTNDTILDGLIRLNQHLFEEKIDIQISVAAEYMINDIFEEMIIKGEPLLTLPDRYILVEMSHLSEPSNLLRVLSLLKAKGYKPVLAHPERYRFYNNNITDFQRLKGLGCKFQVNLLSLIGYYGKLVSDCAWALLHNSMIDFIGTDLHNVRQLQILKENINADVSHFLNMYPFQNDIFLEKNVKV
jgi:protein-tyrosine phosphatase